MATNQSNSKSNESVLAETTPSTGVSLREKAEEMYASYPESVEKREAVEASIKTMARLEAIVATLNAKREAEEERRSGSTLHNGRLSANKTSILYDYDPTQDTRQAIQAELKRMYPAPCWDWVVDNGRVRVFKHKSRR